MKHAAVAVLASTAVLVGCATKWDKPGASEHEFRSDLYQCQREAAGMYPGSNMMATGPGYQMPSQTRCTPTYGGGVNCTTIPGASAPPTQMDMAPFQRAQAVESCLQARGYRKQ